MIVRSLNEIILSLIDYYKLALPDADTKPATVIRDLFIDAPATQLSLLYDEMASVSNKQSLRLVLGTDLDLLAKNFGIIRKQATNSVGVAILTFSSINATINISSGDLVITNSGFSFSVANQLSISPSALNYYRSIATKYKDQLAIAGIQDQYAVETTVRATTAGSSGNVGKYSLSRTTIPNVSNVTNVTAFNGGNDQENDADFRNRVLSSFSGSSVGTALGYLNTALGTTGVSDAVVIQPGDPLMTRDGTQVKINTDGSRTILSEGTGGKVDVVFLGTSLVENTDSFIYQDKSNNNDPTSSKNNYVLGQIAGDENKTISRKRIDNIKAGTLPSQPVKNILEVSGSISGTNFAAKSVDSYGIVSGNYELLKDTGVYGGSPWGFDTFHWISNYISLLEEDKIKGQFNGQDATVFPGVIEIPQIQQSVSITNENSQVSYDRSIIQLLHTPTSSVTRVFNVNTGERYIITSQNYDNTGTYNTTGRIQISGNTLPSSSDVLQVDYNWIIDYDRYSDYDGLAFTSNPRQVTDSIDWGYSSVIKDERIEFVNSGNFFTGISTHPVNTIVAAKKFVEIDAQVKVVTSDIYINRLSVIITNLATSTITIDSITLKNSNKEIYLTPENNGVFINTSIVVGIELLYQTTIILPTDTIAKENDYVTVVTNSSDVYFSSTTNGTASGNQITIPASLVDTLAPSITLRVSYIANITDLFSSSTTVLPASRLGNGYTLNSNLGFNNFSITNNSKRESQTVQKNLLSQYYIELNASSFEYSLLTSQVISVVRVSDGLELWNSDNPGTIDIGTSNNYQLILSGYNTPATNNKVLVLYYLTDSNRFQPFSFSNYLIKTRVDVLQQDPFASKLYININKNTAQSGLSFNIKDSNSDGYYYFSGSDGYFEIISGVTYFSSLTQNFSTLPDLLNKKLLITNAGSNSGTYDIMAYDLINNKLLITQILNNLITDQISIIRIADGKEIWNYSGVISGNQLLLPSNVLATSGDLAFLMIYNFNNLRKSPTKLTNTISDQVVNNGVITTSGLGIYKAKDIVFTSTSSGLKINISEAVRKQLNINSSTAIPSTIKIAKIAKLEKVATVSASSEIVAKVLATYNVKYSTIQNNLLYADEFFNNYSLANLEFVLPSTLNNLSSNNLVVIGDKLRITFYYTIDNDYENLSYTKNGSLYTNKKFALINKIYVSSGFKSSQSTKLTTTSFTQPNTGSRYKIFYDYSAPKQNERIIIRYNYNQLVTDVTMNIENTRPINADVLAREAKLILLDLTMNVVISDSYKSSQDTVIQKVKDQLIGALTTNKLGQVIDTTTLINVAQSVAGVARARVLYFNKTGVVGQISVFQAQEDEYFLSNNVIVNSETR